MPMSPLERTASAMPAHARIIQGRRAAGGPDAPTRKAHAATVVQAVRPMSSVTTPAMPRK